jgi:hypothetical protein
MAPLSREAAWLQEPVPASALFTEVQEGKFVYTVYTVQLPF